MATFAGSDLKKWRESQNISAADLAERISVDVSTLYRYENGKQSPDPDVMYQICQELGDVRRWHVWMRTEYPQSYGREHPEPIMYDLPGTIMMLYSEVRDLEDLERQAMQDGADGRIDSLQLHESFLKEITELIKAAKSAKALLERREKPVRRSDRWNGY